MKPTCKKSEPQSGKSRRTRKNLPPTTHSRRMPGLEGAPTNKMLERVRYRGWDNAYRISNSAVSLIVLADVGPRIISYHFIGDENIFHEVAEEAGLTGGTDFRLYGG